MKEITEKIKGRVINKIIDLQYHQKKNEKHLKMSKFIDDYFILTNFISSEEDYINVCNQMDLLVYGSDQIWYPELYHSFYYGNYDSMMTPKISYAPSLGVERLVDASYVDMYKKL